MQVDLFTLVAQIVNFLVLMVLLRVFLYDRVLQAMDAREERINSRLNEAEETLASAEEERETYEQKQKEWEREKNERTRRAREEVNERRKEWLEEARSEVDHERQGWLRELDEAQEEFLGELRLHVGRESVSMSRQVLTNLANADLEDEVIEAFLERLSSLEDEERAGILSADAWKLVSAFSLSEERRERVRQGLTATLGDGQALEFTVSGELVAGIELRFDGGRMGWNISAHLDRLERSIREHLRDETRKLESPKSGRGSSAEDEDNAGAEEGPS